MPRTTNGVKTNRLNIYMIKPEYQRLEDIAESTESPHEIEGVGHFLFEESHPHQPEWVRDFFGSTLDGDIRLLSSGAKGVLIIPIRKQGDIINFAISFGSGRYLLKEGVIEERFGLKTVLNSVDPESFRSIEKTTLGSVPKHSHEQMSRDVAPSEFGIDIEQDLISSITGKSKDERLGKTITGKDALSLSVKIDITNVQDFLSHCLDRYRSTDYKRNFDWIDQIAEVRNKRIGDSLNARLIEKINHEELEKIWMAVPEIINWSDVKGFRYLRAKRADLHDDLDLEIFLDSIDGETIDIDLLKDSPVFLISARSDDVSLRWSALRCIYAEINYRNKLYILNNGKWYEIASGFSQQVERDFSNIDESNILLPDCSVNDEASYNVFAAQNVNGSCNMDQKLIMHGGGYSRIEFCDLYTRDGKIVHIKKYGNSSILSHLFSQGVVSGELFVSDNEFRQKLNRELPDSHKLTDPNARPNATEYEIVYGIISKSEDPLDLPFFSKVSLRNARRRLTSYGYQVTIKKIRKIEEPVETTNE